MIDPEKILIALAWLALGSFAVVLIGGMTNRFVVYVDTTDLAWAISPYFLPVISVMMASSFMSNGDRFQDSNLAIFILALGMLGAVYGAYKTFYASVKHNGLALGLFVGCFKSLIALLVAVVSIGLLFKIFNKKSALGKKATAAAFLGGAWWFTSKLINGETYYASRNLAMPRS